MSEGVLVPFGKYKDQPVEVLASDHDYCDWLVAQGWFAQRYPQVHTLVINNFGEPTETPAHNALQLRFLEASLRLKLSTMAVLGLSQQSPTLLWPGLLQEVGSPVFEQYGIDVQWSVLPWVYNTSRTWNFGWSPWVERKTIAVECKPTLGDDYPAVLRQVLRYPLQPLRMVVAEAFTAIGGTLLQVQQLFLASGVLFVLLEDVLALPSIELFPHESQLPPISAFTTSRPAEEAAPMGTREPQEAHTYV